MIENITNIGQLLIHADQAVACKSDAPSSKRFSISEDQNLHEENTSEIPTADNKFEDVRNSNENSDVQKNEHSVEKKLNNEPKPKIESQENNKQVNENNKTEESAEDKLPENEQVNPQSDVVINDSAQNELPEQDEISSAVAFYIPEQSNTVTGHAVKSEQIKTLHETKKGQLGIKTILPENSNGENGLKQVLAPVGGQQSEAALSEVKTNQNISEQPSNENAELMTLKTSVNKNNQTNDKDIINVLHDQKKVLPDTVSQDNAEKADYINDLKAAQQVSQAVNSHTQSVTDTDKHTKEQQADHEISISQTAQEGDDLFDDSAGNTSDSLKQKPDIAELLPSISKDSVDNIRTLDDNKLIVEQTFANNQTDEAQKYSSIISEKVNPDILKNNSENDVSAQISKQIAESIHSSTIQQSGEKQITIRLNPPELGTVMIKFSERNSELTGSLEVSKSQTKVEIEHALPDIIRSLSESGIQLRRIDVVSSENRYSNSDSAKEQLMQGDNSGRSDQGNSQNQNAGAGDFNKSRFRQWFSNTIEYRRGYSLHNQFITSGSINMLA